MTFFSKDMPKSRTHLVWRIIWPIHQLNVPIFLPWNERTRVPTFISSPKALSVLWENVMYNNNNNNIGNAWRLLEGVCLGQFSFHQCLAKHINNNSRNNTNNNNNNNIIKSILCQKKNEANRQFYAPLSFN